MGNRYDTQHLGEVIRVRLPRALARRAHTAARTARVTVSALIRRALEELLLRRPPQGPEKPIVNDEL